MLRAQFLYTPAMTILYRLSRYTVMTFIPESKIKHGNRGQGKSLENDKSIEALVREYNKNEGSRKILIYFYHFSFFLAIE